MLHSQSCQALASFPLRRLGSSCCTCCYLHLQNELQYSTLNCIGWSLKVKLNEAYLGQDSAQQTQCLYSSWTGPCLENEFQTYCKAQVMDAWHQSSYQQGLCSVHQGLYNTKTEAQAWLKGDPGAPAMNLTARCTGRPPTGLSTYGNGNSKALRLRMHSVRVSLLAFPLRNAVVKLRGLQVLAVPP